MARSGPELRGMVLQANQTVLEANALLYQAALKLQEAKTAYSLISDKLASAVNQAAQAEQKVQESLTHNNLAINEANIYAAPL